LCSRLHPRSVETVVKIFVATHVPHGTWCTPTIELLIDDRKTFVRLRVIHLSHAREHIQ